MKCVVCGREATFDSPRKYCDLHWVLWWTEDYEKDGMSKDALKYERIDALKTIWNKHTKPQDAKRMIEEIEDM